ncbi:syntaxin-17-like [Stegodyphus dumicola]|uniref:syntaxin-17-like n=1 Tax=Stegodyphus dumicola TaxID=202533 RepID=UPI0015B3094D|nr:syntaxin-17-like [Stegodyphus dumicola]
MQNIDNDSAPSESIAELPKLPFKRLQFALNQVVSVAIPLHVQLLRQQSENIQNLKIENRSLELRSEQVKAAKTVQLLKNDLFELEQLNVQVKDEDKNLFLEKIESPAKNAIEVLSEFMELHSDSLEPFPDVEFSLSDSSSSFPTLTCQLDKSPDHSEETPVVIGDLQVQKYRTSGSSLQNWTFLRKELSEIRDLIRQFASLVFQQQENVDTIQNNLQRTHENVYVGTQYLKKASVLKAASFPVTGAVIGGLLLGPVGALAGFKLLGSIACVAGGGVLGFGAGVKLKKKQQAICELEMKSLTYPSKSLSLSNPELSVCNNTNKKD